MGPRKIGFLFITVMVFFVSMMGGSGRRLGGKGFFLGLIDSMAITQQKLDEDKVRLKCTYELMKSLKVLRTSSPVDMDDMVRKLAKTSLLPECRMLNVMNSPVVAVKHTFLICLISKGVHHLSRDNYELRHIYSECLRHPVLRRHLAQLALQHTAPAFAIPAFIPAPFQTVGVESPSPTEATFYDLPLVRTSSVSYAVQNLPPLPIDLCPASTDTNNPDCKPTSVNAENGQEQAVTISTMSTTTGTFLLVACVFCCFKRYPRQRNDSTYVKNEKSIMNLGFDNFLDLSRKCFGSGSSIQKGPLSLIIARNQKGNLISPNAEPDGTSLSNKISGHSNYVNGTEPNVPTLPQPAFKIPCPILMPSPCIVLSPASYDAPTPPPPSSPSSLTHPPCPIVVTSPCTSPASCVTPTPPSLSSSFSSSFPHSPPPTPPHSHPSSPSSPESTPSAVPLAPPPPPPPPPSLSPPSTLLSNVSSPMPTVPPPPTPITKSGPQPPPPPPKSPIGHPSPRGLGSRVQQVSFLEPNHPENGSESYSSVTKTKLKPFFWDKVLANIDQSMVWQNIRSGSFRFDEKKIEKLFGYNSSIKSNEVVRKELSSNDSSVRCIQLLDHKKSQNLSISLKALNVKTEEVCDALMEGNELPVELLQILLRMQLTTDEELKLRFYTGNLSLLGPAEQFLKALVDIPFAFKRIDVLLFMSSLHEDVSRIKDAFATLEEACTEVRSKRLFLKLLEAVLKTGNRMNDGTFRGGAQAFKLDTLLKLSDVKGSDGKTTLLHFVVQEIIISEGRRAACLTRENKSLSGLVNFNSDEFSEESPREDEDYYRNLGLEIVSGLSSELENVKKAAVMDMDTLRNMAAGFNHKLIKTKEFLHTDMENIGEESGFHHLLKYFVEHAEAAVTLLRKEESRITLLLQKTMDSFHGNAGKDEGLRLFVIVRDFLGMLDKACKEVRETQKKASHTQKYSSNSNAPKSPDPRQPLFPAIADQQVDNFGSDED